MSEPYYNEPGHQLKSADNQSILYNQNIRLGTIRWAILDSIRKPSPCFKNIIHTHFSLKKQDILKRCEEWQADDSKFKVIIFYNLN